MNITTTNVVLEKMRGVKNASGELTDIEFDCRIITDSGYIFDTFSFKEQLPFNVEFVDIIKAIYCLITDPNCELKFEIQ